MVQRWGSHAWSWAAAESLEQGPTGGPSSSAHGRKGKLRAVTSSEKQGCVVVSCHKCRIHTRGCRWEGEVGKGRGALLRRVSPPAFLPVAVG